MAVQIRLLASLSGDEEVLEVVEAEVIPAVGEVGGSLEAEDQFEVLVVLVVALIGLAEEAEPHSPLVQKQLTLEHIL